MHFWSLADQSPGFTESHNFRKIRISAHNVRSVGHGLSRDGSTIRVQDIRSYRHL